MLSRFRAVIGRGLAAVLVVGLLAALPIGCGDDKPATGAKSEQPPEIQKANQNMLDAMKKGPTK